MLILGRRRRFSRNLTRSEDGSARLSMIVRRAFFSHTDDEICFMSDRYKIRFQGDELGDYSVDQLYRMAMRGEIDHTAEFWSARESSWRPLAGIIIDSSPSRVGDMRQAGITKVKILGSGDDCPICSALQERVYGIDEVPTLPPPSCTCVPWCRCVETALE